MAKTLEEMMANFTIEEQEEIQAEANQLITEEITLRQSLLITLLFNKHTLRYFDRYCQEL